MPSWLKSLQWLPSHTVKPESSHNPKFLYDLAACCLPPRSPSLDLFYNLVLKCCERTLALGPLLFAVSLPGKLSPRFQCVFSVPPLGPSGHLPSEALPIQRDIHAPPILCPSQLPFPPQHLSPSSALSTSRVYHLYCLHPLRTPIETAPGVLYFPH